MPAMMPDQALAGRLIEARSRYGVYPFYDEVLTQVQNAAQQRGSIGKCDIGALMLWKRLNLSSKWADELNKKPDDWVRGVTSAAIEHARNKSLEIPAAASAAREALLALPGCQSKGNHAVASAILTAGAPHRMAVYDRRACEALELLHCPAPRDDFGRYMDTVCTLMSEVNDSRNLDWYPRAIDQALYILGKEAATDALTARDS
jgi:hypothetical protein